MIGRPPKNFLYTHIFMRFSTLKHKRFLLRGATSIAALVFGNVIFPLLAPSGKAISALIAVKGPEKLATAVVKVK